MDFNYEEQLMHNYSEIFMGSENSPLFVLVDISRSDFSNDAKYIEYWEKNGYKEMIRSFNLFYKNNIPEKFSNLLSWLKVLMKKPNYETIFWLVHKNIFYFRDAEIIGYMLNFVGKSHILTKKEIADKLNMSEEELNSRIKSISRIMRTCPAPENIVPNISIS